MRTLWIVSCVVTLSACGGGGGNDAQGEAKTGAIGYLKGPSIQGLPYQAGDVAPSTGTLPVTDAAGRYQVAATTIRFYFGRLDLGSAPVAEVITWPEIAGDATQAANKALLVSLADDDGNPTNGIRIAPELTARALYWNVDFSSATFVADLRAVILPDIESVYGRTIVVSTSQPGVAAFTAGFQCTYAGFYSGEWYQPQMPELEKYNAGYAPIAFGGAMLMLVTTPRGRVVGHEQWIPNATVNLLEGTSDLPMQAQPYFILDTRYVTYHGEFSSLQRMRGDMTTLPFANGESLPAGNMGGERIAGSATAVQRFSVAFAAGGARYLLLIDVDTEAQANATVIVNDAPPVSLNGTVVDQQLVVNSTSGNYRFEGQIQPDTNVLTGTWSDSVKSASRTFTADGPIVGCHT